MTKALRRIVSKQMLLIYTLTLMSATKDKRIQVLIPEDLWKQYRLYCFEHETNMSDDVRKYITDLIKRSRDDNGETLV